MGYTNFGKVKTIVLPSPSQRMTLEQYKEKYGIDLKDFLVLENGKISLKSEILNSSLILVMHSDVVGVTAPLFPVGEIASTSAYESASTDSITSMRTIYNHEEESFYGIILTVLSTDPFDMEHVKITTIEF